MCQDCGADNTFPIRDFVAVVGERNRCRLALEDIERVAGRFIRRGHSGFEYDEISEALSVALQELSVIRRKAAAALDAERAQTATACAPEEAR
jgi:hypothetical protein